MTVASIKTLCRKTSNPKSKTQNPTDDRCLHQNPSPQDPQSKIQNPKSKIASPFKASGPSQLPQHNLPARPVPALDDRRRYPIAWQSGEGVTFREYQ
jgi:hypothetical protein